MGKRLRQQRRGKGSPAYARPPNRFKTDLSFRKFDEQEKQDKIVGIVTDFVDDPARSAMLMNVQFGPERGLLLAPEGIKIGDAVEAGRKASVRVGAIMPLGSVPDGLPVYNIEMVPGDGGKFVRAAGTCGYVISHEGGVVTVSLPSKREKVFSPDCRAQIGVICGGGRKDRPMLTAGKKFYAMRARNMDWPKVRGVAMNAVSHPFGGSQHHAGKSTCVSRNAPPGRKVGHLAAPSTGRASSRKRKETKRE